MLDGPQFNPTNQAEPLEAANARLTCQIPHDFLATSWNSPTHHNLPGALFGLFDFTTGAALSSVQSLHYERSQDGG
jgi:hypothetical protein